MTVALGEVDLPERPTEVRVVARDTIAGAGTWFGVSAPRLAVARPVAELTAGARRSADQVSAVFWPCVDQIEIRDGLAEPPAFRLRAGDGLEGAIFAPQRRHAGADQSHRGVRRAALPAARRRPHARLGARRTRGVRPPTGGYDLTVDTVRRAGWTRLPTLVGEAYTGRGFIG